MQCNAKYRFLLVHLHGTGVTIKPKSLENITVGQSWTLHQVMNPQSYICDRYLSVFTQPLQSTAQGNSRPNTHTWPILVSLHQDNDIHIKSQRTHHPTNDVSTIPTLPSNMWICPCAYIDILWMLQHACTVSNIQVYVSIRQGTWSSDLTTYILLHSPDNTIGVTHIHSYVYLY